jgi:hypothetical protein
MKALYDPTEAFFAGFTSTWSRLLLFFGTAFVGHFIG